MFYFKDDKDQVHAIDTLDAVGLLPAGSIEITAQEASALSNPQLPHAVSIKEQIIALEAEVTPRRMREAALGSDDGWLLALDKKIAELRAKLVNSGNI